MGFDAGAAAYDRFMGRFSGPLADLFVDALDVRPPDRALDVGSGPGALTARLVGRVGADRVVAVDPTPAFVAAVADRYPGVDVRRAVAEDLPFEDDAFDVVGAQLVVHFMSDAVAGVREMRRVARPGGRVGACVWDHRDRGPLTTFWRAAREVGSGVAGEDSLAGVRRGHLAELFTQAGVRHIEESELTVARTFGTFEDWWEPFTLGVGPAGEHVAGLDARGRDALRTRCADVLGEPPFTVGATAWCVLGHA